MSEQGELLDLIAQHDELTAELFDLYKSIANDDRGSLSNAASSLNIKLNQALFAFGRVMNSLRNGCCDDAEFIQQASQLLMILEKERAEFLSSVMTESSCDPTHDGNVDALRIDIEETLNQDDDGYTAQDIVNAFYASSLESDANSFIDDR